MKKLITYLKALWGAWGNLQSSDVRHDCRLTVGSPSGFGSKSLLKFVSVLALIFTLGVGNVWGATATFTASDQGWSGTSTKTQTVSGVTFSFAGGTTNPTYYAADGLRTYENCVITISSTNTITGIVFTYTISNSGYLKSFNTGTWTSGTKTWSGSATTISCTVGHSSGKKNGQVKITEIVVTYTASCTKIGAPTVTATPGDGRIDLSWSNQTGASSYTVTKTPSGGSVGTPSKSGSTWSCAITGLTNGTTYTWSVEAVGSGDYCASGNTAASASATPNVFRTITYYDKDGQHTTSLADGTNIATALTALYGGDDPVSCDATNYEYFVGWKVGEISGTASSVTLLDDEVVNSSSPSNNYYAVWSDTDPSAGGWTKVTSIAVGDVVVFAYDDDYKEMTGVTTTGTTYGSAAAVDPYPDDLSGDYALTVEAGNGGTGYSFKHGSVYLSWSSGNSLTTSGTKNDASSWTISESTNGNFKLANVGTTSRILQYNSGSPRWACYGNSGQSAFQIYKQGSAGTPEYITTCCTELATINGSFSFTSVGTTGATANWGWTGATTGISKNILKVYKESDNSLVATIDNISASATSQAITGLDPCTEYYVKLSTVSSGGGYCDGVADQTGASHVTFTTSSYTVTKTGVTNVTAASLSAIPATTCASGFGPITIEAASGYVLPATVTVTGATGSWTQASGSLTISSVTGNVSITITPTAASCASFSFHTGTGEDATVKTTNTTTCFSQVNSSTTWKIDNYVIPADTKFFVGDRGFFYDDNLGSNNSRSAVKTWSQEMFFEYTKAYGDGYRPTVGQATGAIGTLYIWSDNNWNNLHVGFSPQGYVFKLGSTNLSMSGSATLDADRYWETSVITLTSTDISGNYQTNLYTGSAGGVASNNTQSTAVNTMGVKTNAGDNWRGTAINDGTDANTRGFFRIDIGDGGAKNWHAHWVPTHRVVFHPNYPGGGGEDQYSVDVSVEETNSSIALASAPSNPTGYTFAGWYDAADGGNHITTARTISAGASANVELWAHWTANTISLTLNKNNNDASGSTSGSASVKYNNTALESGTTHATREHYTLEGYYAEAGCTHKVLTAAGALVNYTGYVESDKWVRNTTPTTLYANWTPANYTVTWYAGGTASGNITTAGNPSTSVAYNSKVTDLPTNPDGSACDKVFVGWTDDTDYDHGTSLLFTDAAGSPTITGATNFYAVYATESVGNTTLLEEDFSEITTGNSTSTSGSSTTWGRNANFSTGANTYSAGGAVRLGSGSNTGNLTTKQLTAAIGDEITVAFKVKGWSSVEGDISVSGLYSEFTKPSDITYTAVMDGAFESKSVTVTLTSADPYIVIATTAKRAFIDDLVITKSGITYTGHTITCADCGSSVTPTYTAAPTGGTVSVTKNAAAVASGSTVKTCTSVDLTVTITPTSHYTLTGFTATGLTTGTATISPAVNTVVPTTSAQTFTVTVSAGATGTLNLTPTLEEEAHKVISWVVHGGSASIADGHGTTWVYSGENLTGIPSAPSAPAGCVDKEFVGWSENDGGATEGDASDYTDLFTTLGGAPTGITADKTFTAVFATPAAGMGGTVIWDEPFDGDAGDQPSSPTSGATVYGSASIAYNCASTTYCKLYTDNLASGGAASPELLIPKSSRSEAFEVTGIPTAGQTELTLTYMAKDALSVTTGTSGVTVGDASADGNLYTRTITIDQSGLGVATFGLTFAKSTDSNSRLDDIHLVVPGSSSSSAYVTTCEETYTITYNKNTTDPVTNLPSPTGISQATGSGTLSSKVPVRYAYTFMGWSNTSGENNTVDYAAGAAISSVSADKTLYAVWQLTAVTEINLSKSSLDKYVGDPSVTLSVLSVLPDGASTSVNWSSSNTSVATVSASGEVNFLAVGTATITATSTVTNTTTATCVVTVWAKPTATFLDNMHGLTVDENSVALSSYNLEAAAGTAVVFPTLANQIAGSGTCEDEHYIFVGWTTSDNNDDPEDHLVSSYTLTNGDAITYYAVWADGVSGTTYVKLTDNSFSTSKHYVIGAVHPDNGTTYYFNSCAKTDKDNSWGYVTADLASDTPIEFTLSGTASALVATTTESTSRYLKPTSTNEFHMSSISQTIMLKSDGKIYSTDETRRLLLNKSQPGLRWYGTGAVSGTSNAYFYEVVAGGEVNYRTSCCADKVPAPTVTATQTSVSVTLNWNDLSGSGATGYEVSWNDGAWTSPSGTRTHSVSGLTPNTTYTWKVRATYTTPKCGADIASGSTTTNQVYHVTYAGGSGTGTCNATGSTTDATAYEAGATVTLQANGFTLVGHTFNEWTEDDEDITISSNQFTMPEHDVVITATWTPKVDKFYDRMHDGTDASHGGIADGDGKYYITREGCSYTVPSLTDNTSGATACHTKHYVLMGWTAESHLNSDGTLKTGHEGYVYTGGGTQTATGATYYAVWAEVEE